MRLARLDLTRYGKFTGGSLDFGEKRPGRPDLHIVYGPNEAGKSTAFSAFLDLLFGIETQSEYAFLHPYRTMKIEAALELGGDAPRVFGRIKRPQNSLLDASDQPVGDTTLLGGFGGLDRAAYRNMFSLDDDTLEKGGQTILASKGDLGQLLFSASAGLAELGQTLEALRGEADRFHRGRSKSELTELKAQLDRLKGEREQLDTLLPTYRKLVETSETSRARYESEMAERAVLQVRSHAVERLLQALPRYARLLALRERLQPMSRLPHPPSNWREELPVLQREAIEIATQLHMSEAEIANLKAEFDSVQLDEPILRVAERIDELHADARARFVTAEKDLPERRRSLADHDGVIAKLLRRLERDDSDPDSLVLGASILGAFGELIEQRSGVEAKLDTARRQYADAEQGLAEAEAALTAAGGAETASGASVAALKNLLSAVRENDHAARRRHAEKTRVLLLDNLAARMSALRPWTGTVEQLVEGAPPQPADLAGWNRVEAELAQAIGRHDTDIERLTTEQHRLKTELDAAGQFAGVITEAEAAGIRMRREQAWAAHRRNLEMETADVFEAALREDDLVTNARLSRDGELARIRQIGQALAMVETDLARAGQMREIAVSGQEQLARDIDEALRILGWPVGTRASARDLENWLQQRTECLVLQGKLRDEERAIETADADARDARDRIAAALAAAGIAPPSAASFRDVLALAEVLVDRESNLSGLRAQCADRRSALTKRQRELSSAEAAHADWTAAWARTCASCWVGDGGAVPTFATVREILAALAELGPWLEKRGALALRVSKMEDDQALFTRDLDRLAVELGPEPASGSALDRAAALVERLRVARSEDARRRELSSRLAELESRRIGLVQAKTVHVQRAASMTTFFGVAGLTEVGMRLEQAKERAELALAAGEAEDEIVATLGASSLAEAEGVLGTAERMALEAERDDLKLRLAEREERTRALYAEHTRARDAVAAVGGDDAVARIAEHRRTVLLATEDKALRYLRLRIGIAAAEQALRAYRDKHRSAMMSRASDAFRIISRGAYSGLAAQPGEKGDVLVALGAGASKEASQLSKGTRFQLYLALRVAGYYEYCRSREPVPFVADDIMETFDDFRAEEAFRLFAGMAEVGQVIYLTHHRHLCDIARTVCPDVGIVELPAAA